MQADCAKIKTDLTALAETCRVTSEANNADKQVTPCNLAALWHLQYATICCGSMPASLNDNSFAVAVQAAVAEHFGL